MTTPKSKKVIQENVKTFSSALERLAKNSQPSDEGWIPHDGWKMPCDGELEVDVKFRDGDVSSFCKAKGWIWGRYVCQGDIMFWRPHKNADGQAGQKVEPVAWMNPDNGVVIDAKQKKQVGVGYNYPNFSVPLYTHPEPSQEGHAAGPACSAPDEALLIEDIANHFWMWKNDVSSPDVVKAIIREFIRRSAQGGEQTAEMVSVPRENDYYWPKFSIILRKDIDGCCTVNIQRDNEKEQVIISDCHDIIHHAAHSPVIERALAIPIREARRR